MTEKKHRIKKTELVLSAALIFSVLVNIVQYIPLGSYEPPLTWQVHVYGWVFDYFTNESIPHASVHFFLDREGEIPYVKPSFTIKTNHEGFYDMTFIYSESDKHLFMVVSKPKYYIGFPVFGYVYLDSKELTENINFTMIAEPEFAEVMKVKE